MNMNSVKMLSKLFWTCHIVKNTRIMLLISPLKKTIYSVVNTNMLILFLLYIS